MAIYQNIINFIVLPAALIYVAFLSAKDPALAIPSSRALSTPLLSRTTAFLSSILTPNTANMSAPKAGDAFPSDVTFSYVPWSPENADVTACGIPVALNASKEWADKKVVLFALPGAFTPTCSARHLPAYIENLEAFKAKGVDVVAVVAYNDAWVMSAWSKANGVKEDSILFLTDADTKFSEKFGWVAGGRTARYAIVVDKGVITYAEKEPAREVTVSGAEAVLAAL